MNSTPATGTADPVMTPAEPSEPRLPATERVRRRLSALMTRAAVYVVAVDGLLIVLAGVFALFGSIGSFQGEGFLLVVGGLALVLFGSMILLRWNLPAVRTGLIGLTAGYFATALTEFQVATDPCDINATLASCAGHLPSGAPWIVYQGPLILAMLLFVLIAFEPLLAKRDRSAG